MIFVLLFSVLLFRRIFMVSLSNEILQVQTPCLNQFHETNFNKLTTNVSHHIKTIQLICCANQLTGVYMTGTTGR